jgi:two-component system chemotaxis sensor kinase CheA
VSQLDLLVSDLQNAVMKTRMQPIGRLFQKYPRIARDLARNLGKDVELALVGEETEIDKTMIEDLSDPDHPPDPQRGRSRRRVARGAAGGRQAGEERRAPRGAPGGRSHRHLIVADDGRGMDAERFAPRRRKGPHHRRGSQHAGRPAEPEPDLPARLLDHGAGLGVSGRGVGMDVVQDQHPEAQRLDRDPLEPGKGSTFIISTCR